CVCVLDDDQLRGAVGELLAAVRPGSIVVSHSTVEPQTISELARAAKARDVELVDAPVSGGEPGAKNKTMAYMVGGSPDAFARCRPVFETSGTNILHAGPSGSGIRTKLAHQLMVCVNMLSAYEGMRIGQEAGLSAEVLEKAINAGFAQSRVADRWFKRKLGAHSRDLFSKDLRLCLKFAAELKVPVPGAALAQQMLDTIVTQE
ncbi:MAG TPA: NAD(P)-dependent oxidoreductase, partial [Burkholderiales bacterium]|nr:NAD(P)-dependent oxidoreductase [Burkholderiales bacterium]